MVTPDDIGTVLGRPPSQSDAVQWQVWINDARMLIRVRLGDLSALDQDVLDYVTRESVVAHVRRPDDATTVQVQIDDASSSRTYSTSKGRVGILDEWWDLLSPSDDGDAFSIGPACETTPPNAERWPWVGC